MEEEMEEVEIHKGKIIEVKNEAEDYYRMKIEFEENFSWKAGQYMTHTLVGVDINGSDTRTFSIASIPSEKYVLVGFRTNNKPSAFKQYIIDHGVGTEVSSEGPDGDFVINEDLKPVILYASGVGITPIFSILKDKSTYNGRKIHFIHASDSHYLFKDEIDKILKEHTDIEFTFTRTIEETQNELIRLANKYANEAYYYNSGSPAVVESVSKLLIENGVNKESLINDSFYGY